MTEQEHQEISIVHEYEILYSDRIRQKDKKWNDGTLKFYEYNSKLEIFNDAKNLIGADFVRDKQIPFILGTLLADDNEFVLPSGKFIIQVLGFLHKSERDISDAFKKRSTQAPGSQQQVNTIKSQTGVSTRTAASATRRVVLTIDTASLIKDVFPTEVSKSTSPFLGNTPTIPMASSSRLRNKRILHPAKSTTNSVGKAKDRSISKSNMPQEPKTSIQKLPQTRLHTSEPVKSIKNPQNILKLLVERERKHIRSLPRIPPMSSTYFKNMHISGESTQAFETPITSFKGGLGVPNEQEVQVKDEFVVSSTKVEDADIIYDFSDFEEDEKFREMIQEQRRQREQLRDDESINIE